MDLKTTVFYKGGGTTYTFPFEYLQKNFVKVRYQKPDASYVDLEYEKDYTVMEDKVNLLAAGSTEDLINIYRQTPTDRLVKYVDASILKAHDMNVDELQTLHIMEEQTDYLTSYALFKADNANRWDARQLRLTNVALPQEPTDAVNKAYVDEYGVRWDQNVAQMQKQLIEQNASIKQQLKNQDDKTTKILSDKDADFKAQFKKQEDSFNALSDFKNEAWNVQIEAQNKSFEGLIKEHDDAFRKSMDDKIQLAKKWAVSSESPDGAVGSKSAKTWAEEAKSYEQKATTIANNAKASENNAKTSELNAKASETASAKSASAAKGSEDKAKTSEVNAKASEVAAAESAKQATAGQLNADWNEMDADSKAYIKNKPDVVLKSDLSTSVSTTSLTVTGTTSVPTANEGNSSKAIATTEFVAKSISALVNGAPDQLNTLNELAKALGNDSNFASTVTAELAKKLNSAEAENEYATKMEAGVPYQIKRNTAYKVGDVLTSPSLPPGFVIVVTQAGTTGSTEPDWAAIKSNIVGG
ncbi:MAG: hypothetical protein KHX13_04900 [Acidaminococcus intestini]|uniref:Bacteriophage T7 tail fibre protein-like N-terminal domain-containing protein n=1 Tax=Acidaminococcus intestini TaxID=187327 RepID=A0A943EEP3_9FIRM|nr:hypothetical protein [Acidaminococcus intestini]